MIAVDTGPRHHGHDTANALLKTEDWGRVRSSMASSSPTADRFPTMHEGMKVRQEELTEAVGLIEQIVQSDPELRRSTAENIRRSILRMAPSDKELIFYHGTTQIFVNSNIVECHSLSEEFRDEVADCGIGMYHYSISVSFDSARVGGCEDLMDRLFDSVFRDTPNAFVPQHDADSFAPPPHPPSDPPRRASRGNHLIYIIDQNIRDDGLCAYGMTIHFK